MLSEVLKRENIQKKAFFGKRPLALIPNLKGSDAPALRESGGARCSRFVSSELGIKHYPRLHTTGREAIYRIRYRYSQLLTCCASRPPFTRACILIISRHGGIHAGIPSPLRPHMLARFSFS